MIGTDLLCSVTLFRLDCDALVPSLSEALLLGYKHKQKYGDRIGNQSKKKKKVLMTLRK